VQRVRRVPRKLAILVAIAGTVAAAGIVLDLTVDCLERWFRNHAFATAMITNALVLLVAYAIIDEFLERREARRWHKVAHRPMIEFLQAFNGVRLNRGAKPSDPQLLIQALLRTKEKGAGLGEVLLASPHLLQLYEPLAALLNLVRGAETALEAQMWDEATLRRSVEAQIKRANALAEEASSLLGTSFAVSATGRPPATAGPT
jgi:hypothetical protein